MYVWLRKFLAFYTMVKSSKKLNLKLSFETQSYMWSQFVLLFFIYFRVLPLLFSDNNTWIEPKHAYNYWLIRICLYPACVIFFYLIIKVLLMNCVKAYFQSFSYIYFINHRFTLCSAHLNPKLNDFKIFYSL